MGFGERQPAFLWVSLQVIVAFFQRREEFLDFRLAYRVAIGDDNQLVVGWHAVVFHVKHHRILALQL
ncbi:hypothetical protein D3C80_2051660 [compost metagenome]